MSAALIEPKEASVSSIHPLLPEVVRLAASHYGDLNTAIGESATPQELVDHLRTARRTLWRQQATADANSPLHERLAKRIIRITSFIDQAKVTFEGEVK